MSEMTLVLIKVDGDAAIATAMNRFFSEQQNGHPAVAAPAPSILTVPMLQNGKIKSRRSRTEKLTPARSRTIRKAGFQNKALAVLRASHEGMTSEEVYKAVGCENSQSAYKICLELMKKGLIERLDDASWKALSAPEGE